MVTTSSRLTLQKLVSPRFSPQEAAELTHSLTQIPKQIPPKYFYDDRGSQLFEAICLLPEYYLTRTETELLAKVAPQLPSYTGACELVELGSGSSRKTHIILQAYQQRGLPLRYTPIDISSSILEISAYNLLQSYPGLEVHGIVATYEEALAHLPPTQLPCRLLYFLGSSLGNLDRQQCATFFQQVYQGLQGGDYFLLGVDLHKDKAILEAAYNDAQGVTAAFNLNILAHLNRRFGANFNLSNFRHVAIYNDAEHQIEMYLESLVNQDVYLQGLDLRLSLQAGERIRTEISRKFNLPELTNELRTKGFRGLQTWQDDRGWFGLWLGQKV
ncbi:MAG: L-histidine N(alpha)-methyltransferase [Pseudanabaenaceae cyanobacterium SKYGB_i_bin29]|nr:L-histidine N(alpha)-methyltransferase [Pseudanabaenaceae cyanobacterium SKYG29]MDW8421475.1 L-histidine N(alpha)-methyltransferase [Pseudanabaenaceae cyanobacterium SKYGB_i_bin29]